MDGAVPYLALVKVNLHSGEEETVYAHPSADVVTAVSHPDTGVPDLAFVYATTPHWVGAGSPARGRPGLGARRAAGPHPDWH